MKEEDKSLIVNLLDIWRINNVEAVNKVCAKEVVCDNFFVDRIIGNNNVSKHSQKCLDAFSVFSLNTNIQENKGIFLAEYELSLMLKDMFMNFPPTNKKFKFSGYALYKVEDHLITKAYVSSNLFASMFKHGHLPSIMTNDYKNDLLTAIKHSCGLNLTQKEIYITSLWISGYSIKETSKITQISPRTIEDYHTRIKNKFKIQNRKDLYDLLRNLKVTDLFFCFAKESFIWKKHN